MYAFFSFSIVVAYKQLRLLVLLMANNQYKYEFPEYFPEYDLKCSVDV